MTATIPYPRVGDSEPEGDRFDAELAVLHAKAARITGELAELYRRIGELHQQIQDHQRR